MLQNANNEMSEAWCREKLANLKIEEQRLSTLAEIKGQLKSTADLSAIVSNKLLSSPELYECLDDGRSSATSEQNEIASDILTICMSNLSLTDSSSPDILDRAIVSPNPHIKGLALNTILKEFLKHKHGMDHIISSEILMAIIEAMRHEESSIGVPAMNILSIVLADRLDQPHVKDKLLLLLKDVEVVKCRVFELAVNLAKINSIKLAKVEYILDAALCDLDNDDILLQVNILEILIGLAATDHGLAYFDKRQVFEYVSKRVENMETYPVDRLLVPGIMKFFGKIAAVQPQKIIVGYPHMINILFDALHSGEYSILPAAFDTLANLTATANGKILLDTHYAKDLPKIFKDLRDFVKTLSAELKNRAFSTLEAIFSTEDEQTPNDEIRSLLQRWFMHLSEGSSLIFLMDCYRVPFTEIKVPCLNFIRALCSFNWGILAVKNTPGLLEFLMDRKVDFDKESKYAKYMLIKVLAESTMFDVQTHLQLCAYVNEGPYYIETLTEVATERD